jgi:hypothetical protein
MGSLGVIGDRLSLSQSFVVVLGEVLEVEFLTGDFGVKSEDVFGFVFEVGGGVEAFGDEEAVSGFSRGDVAFGNGDELLLDLADEVEGDFDLLVGIVGLHGGADDGHVVVLLADAVHGRHHHDVDV